jgi:hypothetical protein
LEKKSKTVSRIIRKDVMVQTYRIWLALPDKPTMHYCGLCFGDGITAESRVSDELSHKPPNKDFAAAVLEHGKDAFDWELTGNHDSLLDALNFEAAEIEKYRSWHSDFGWNRTRGIDAKRYKRALAEYTPGASIEDQLDAAITDFTRNNADAWAPWAGPQSEQILREIARKEKVSVTSAFYVALDAGLLTSV